jgi:hypothetical protein
LHVNTENPRPLRLSEFPITFSKKDHWVHVPDSGTYPLVVNPIIMGPGCLRPSSTEVAA